MNKIVLMLAVLLSACGGGGGGGDDAPAAPTPAPAPAPPPVQPTSPAPAENAGSVALSPSVLEVSTVEGESQKVTLTVKLAKPVSGAVFVDLTLPPPFESRGDTEKVDALTYRRTLTTFSNLSAGTKSGLLTVTVVVCPNGCGDAQVIHQSQHQYRVEVLPTQPNLTPLKRLEGAGAWTSSVGNSANTGYVATPTKLDPSAFRLRWKTTGTKYWSSPLAIAGQVVINGSLQVNSLREADGTVAWSVPAITTSSDESVIASGRAFIFDYGPKDSGFIGYGIFSGQKEILLRFPESKPNLQSDGVALYAVNTALQRFDASTGLRAWTSPADIPFNFRRIATDNQYLYSFWFNKLRVYRQSDGGEAFSIDHDQGENSLARPLTAIADGSQRVIGGWYTWSHAYLTSFSITERKKLWAIKDGFRSLPSVAHNMLFVVATLPNSTEAPTLQARSGDTGALVWKIPLPDSVDSQQDVNYDVVTVGDTIFVSSDRTAGGFTYAIDRNSQKIVWKYPVVGKLAVTENGTLLIRSINGNLFAINLRE